MTVTDLFCETSKDILFCVGKENGFVYMKVEIIDLTEIQCRKMFSVW